MRKFGDMRARTGLADPGGALRFRQRPAAPSAAGPHIRRSGIVADGLWVLRPRPLVRGPRAFTLAELLVSVGILALLIITVGVIFAMSTKAASLSNAANEVHNNFRALEQQLRRDLMGIRKDAFLGLCYHFLPPRAVAPDRPEKAAVRADWLVFFANGQFQTIRQRWDSTHQVFGGPAPLPIESNLARIQYGLLGTHDPVTGQASARGALTSLELGRFAKLSVRDLNPLTVPGGNPSQDDPPTMLEFANAGLADAGAGSGAVWDKADDVYENWEFEHELAADWRDPSRYPLIPPAASPNWPSYVSRLIGLYPAGQQRNNLWLGLGYLDVAAAAADHLRMLPGCVQFKVQRWAESNPVQPLDGTWIPRWWPEDNDPYIANGTQLPPGSDGFGPQRPPPANSTWPGLQIWECFNGPADLLSEGRLDVPDDDWPQGLGARVDAGGWGRYWPWVVRDVTYPTKRAVKAEFPKALKFTVSLVDANGRMLQNTSATDQTYVGAVPGAQTFTFVIALE